MSIAPPSDIVLDVAQAADPLRLQAATAKLAKMAAGASAADFGAALDAATPHKPGNLPSSFGLLPRWSSTPTVQARTASPYQKFEAVVLQNFVQNILPKDENLFGDAASADICRSMLAEQLATQIAKTGRLGIARMIEKAHASPSFEKPATLGPVPASPAAAAETGAPPAVTAALSSPSSRTTD